MFAEKKNVYNKKKLPKIVEIALGGFNEHFGGIKDSDIVNILTTDDYTDEENAILSLLSKDDDSDEEEDVISEYALLIVQKIRISNIFDNFKSKNSDVSHCQVATYDLDINKINKNLSKFSGRLKQLNKSTVEKIKELGDEK